MEPGIYSMSNAEYHAAPGISKSGLDEISRSPKHYWQRYLSGRENPDPTPALVAGSLIHTLVLEPDTYRALYAVEPLEINKRTNAGKEDYAAWLNENAGRTIVTVDQVAEAKRVADAVRCHPTANGLLTGGRAEESHVWIDPVTGVLCRCRPDYVRPLKDSLAIIDVKTTRDAGKEQFAKDVLTYRYHVQAAYYCAGAKETTGILPKAFIFIAVEKTPPYAVAVYQADFNMRQLGEETYRADLAVYADCLTKGEWPCYPVAIQELSLPAWAFTK